MTPEQLKELAADLGRYEHDPLGFTLWAFPWGVPGTELEKETGPDAWQRETLEMIGREVSTVQKLRVATASGKGIGKSACVAWVCLWAMMTREHTRGVVTANTKAQLTTKTWAELATWHGRMIPELRELFELTATSLQARPSPMTWRIDALPWSENRKEAFAGLHNKGKRILVVFDEASAVADPIWETTDGIMSDADTEVVWAVFGNPTRNVGMFRECFRKFRDLWRTRRVDSRTVKVTDKRELQALVDAYGEDSDYVRVNVRGEFPRAAGTQFISGEAVEQAQKRVVGYIASDPIVFGVDVARYGDDKSVLRVRRGRDARSFATKKWRGVSTMHLAGEVANEAETYRKETGAWPDAIFVDEGGVGAGVVDRLIQLNVPNVIGVNFGSAGGLAELNGAVVRTANKRAYMYAKLRAWLDGAMIEADDDLATELAAVEYGFNADNAIQLERKEDMKKRIGVSPDDADALALTFAEPVAPRAVEDFGPGSGRVNPYAAFQIPRSSPSHGGDYDIYADL